MNILKFVLIFDFKNNLLCMKTHAIRIMVRFKSVFVDSFWLPICIAVFRLRQNKQVTSEEDCNLFV